MKRTTAAATRRGLATLAVLLVTGASPALAGQEPANVRLKDVATLQGVQNTPLIGYGLVVGLNKTGDRRQTVFSAQTLANMLEKLGVVVQGDAIKVENIAAVLVTAELPPFARPGARIDVTVSSVGDARSLQGGTLVATALRGPDGQPYALAQGPLTLGGFGGGRGGNSVQVNHLTAGRVPGGALVQVPHRTAMPTTSEIVLALSEPDFATARALAAAVEDELGRGSARALDNGAVSVQVPEEYRKRIADLMARLEPLALQVDTPARVVINERTGTVVVGSHVQIGAAAVAHGNLSVTISSQPVVSQPAPFSQGQTVVGEKADIQIKQEGGALMAMKGGADLAEVVRALNALGANPGDLLAILQALKAAGALRADLEVI